MAQVPSLCLSVNELEGIHDLVVLIAVLEHKPKVGVRAQLVLGHGLVVVHEHVIANDKRHSDKLLDVRFECGGACGLRPEKRPKCKLSKQNSRCGVKTNLWRWPICVATSLGSTCH